MKTIRKFLGTVVTGLLFAGLTLNFTACTEQSPLASGDETQDNLNFLVVGDDTQTLNKAFEDDDEDDDDQDSVTSGPMETTEYVTWKDGGELKIEYKGEGHNNGDVYVVTTFKVYQQSISEDAELKLSMSDDLFSGDVDATFQPHGITFSKDAELSIEAKNIDLSGVDVSTIGLYYVSDGQWVKMQVYEIIVKKDKGYLKIDKAKIPHFSTYAIGME